MNANHRLMAEHATQVRVTYLLGLFLAFATSAQSITLSVLLVVGVPLQLAGFLTNRSSR